MKSLVAGLVTALWAMQAMGGASLDVIRQEALSPWIKSLPLAAHWNVGGPQNDGYSAAYQISLLESGEYFLPSVPLGFLGQKNPSAPYKTLLEYLSINELPFTVITTQIEQNLYLRPYCSPNLDGVTGRNIKMETVLSPFSPWSAWEECGKAWAEIGSINDYQSWYPNPPRVVFLSNNESRRMKPRDIFLNPSYMMDQLTESEEDLNNQFRAGWAKLYSSLWSGFSKGLSNEWSRSALPIGYDTLGSRHIGRWDGWREHTLLNKPGDMEDLMTGWKGSSESYYLDDWTGTSLDKVFSPQVEAMNWLHFYKRNIGSKDWWFELSIWDGHQPKNDDESAQILREPSAKQYQGMTRLGMWLLRPKIIREWRPWNEPVEHSKVFFERVLSSVREVHENKTLSKFWLSATPIESDQCLHPYQKDRDGFLLHSALLGMGGQCSYNALSKELDAFVIGYRLDNTVLIYGHAPTNDVSKSIEIEDFGTVDLSFDEDGRFYLVDTKYNTVSVIKD